MKHKRVFVRAPIKSSPYLPSFFTICLLLAICLVYREPLMDFAFRVLNINDTVNGRNLRSAFCEPDDDDGDSGCPKGTQAEVAVLYAVGALYLFIALAIVCDEFFVPALEEIGSTWNMSDDVAGATLMAAGGSAPELATSLIGTFRGSDVGFGTIVGSAVFNVLFVIACCVLCTPRELSPLKLTGWPLARDCFCYIVCLLMVAIVFGVNSPGIIEAWEAAFLFMLYLIYCTIMAYNGELYNYFNQSTGISGDDKNSDEGGDLLLTDVTSPRGAAQFPSHYRAGFVQLLTQDGSIFDTAAVHCVKVIDGDVRAVFDKLDTDGSGTIDAMELKQLLVDLYDTNPGVTISDDHVRDIMKELDVDQNGVVDFAEFTVWYVKSEERLKNEEKRVFDELDVDNSGRIPLSMLGTLLDNLNIQYTQEGLEEAIQCLCLGRPARAQSDKDQIICEEFSESRDFEMVKNGPRTSAMGKDTITYSEFSDWFEHSTYWKEMQHDAEIAAESAEGIWGELLDFPKENTRANAMYLFLAPITWTLACTVGVKDVRIPGNGGWCYYQFVLSIAWIGAYSYLVVDWIEIIGATIGVPSVVMGLTVLAAGTSIPDLLSSVVVAKAGKGDMAVSSSIGSNIFDVCVGLPVPWMLFNIIMDCPVVVGADNLFISVIVLVGMVAAVILSIMASGWKMDYSLGGAMFVLYVVFVIQDVVRVYLTEDIVC